MDGKVAVHLPKPLVERVDAVASDEFRSRANAVQVLVSEALRRREAGALAIHAAGRLLRESGQFQSELMFTGPTDLCLVYLNWRSAVGKEELRQLPGPLGVRRAHDLGWRPGLWLASDHAAAVRGQPEISGAGGTSDHWSRIRLNRFGWLVTTRAVLGRHALLLLGLRVRTGHTRFRRTTGWRCRETCTTGGTTWACDTAAPNHSFRLVMVNTPSP